MLNRPGGSSRPGAVERVVLGELRPQRQPHDEGRPLPLSRALDLGRAAVQLDQVADDRQAEPEPAVGAGDRPVGLAEAVEDVRQEVGADADAGVGHPDDGVAPLLAQADLDPARPGGELDGVGEQVPDHLLQPVGVAEDRARQRADRDVEEDPLGVGRRAHGLERGVDDAAQLDRLEVEPELAGDDARDVEQVVDQLRLERALRSIVSSARAPAAAIELAGAQHLHPAEDGVERGPQLVGEGGQELVLGAVGLLGLLARRLLEDEEAGPLLLGPLADADLPLELLVGHRQLGRPLLDQHLQIVVHPAQGRVGLGELGRALLDLAAQRHLLDGVAHRLLEPVAGDAPLQQVVLRPALHRLHGHRLVPLSGQHDHRDQPLRPQAGEELQAVDVRQPVVEQQAVGNALVRQLQPLLPRLGVEELIGVLAVLGEQPPVELPVLGAVVDDQEKDGCIGHYQGYCPFGRITTSNQ